MLLKLATRDDINGSYLENDKVSKSQSIHGS